MSLLDHPEAQVILADAVITPDAVEGQADRLTSFLQRYLPRFYRVEQRATATSSDPPAPLRAGRSTSSSGPRTSPLTSAR